MESISVILSEYLLMIVSFLTLFIALFWIQVYLFRNKRDKLVVNKCPNVSIIVPAYNEESCIKETVDSLLSLDYSKDKLKIIVVNDGSTDNTSNIVRAYQSKQVILIDKKNSGKAASINAALNKVESEFFGIVDADSIVNKDSLNNMMHLFDNGNIGAVISLTKVKNPTTIFEKMQHLEYIFSAFSRKLMSNVDTLFITPGVLTIFRTDVVKKLGCFDENNLTEDLEIAMKLRYNGYNIKIATNSITYTSVPNNFKSLWNQRIRWFRGYLYNTNKYRNLFFSKKHGFFGLFQVPLNFLTVFLVILIFILASYEILRLFYNFILKLISYKLDIIYSYKLPTLKELIFKLDLKIIFPMIISLILAFYIYNKAHKFANEKWKFPIALILYITIYPSLRVAHWLAALTKEIIGSKKKW
ncbi:glycosyltransferase family 2 protein [Candidatus Woesearchaeota archaeon]|nr:glycosyltransferase family 2 protein [Candidatus Woesearchaeota archaeon]